MLERIILPKFKVAENLLNRRAYLYWYMVDVYSVDESRVSITGNESDYDLYLDYLMTNVETLNAVTIPVRFIESASDVDNREWVYVLSTGFSIGILDSVLRDKKVSLKVGDVIATARILPEVAQHKSFDVFTKPVFVRIVQSVVPRTYVVANVNVLEWEVRLSHKDVVFRYYV